MPWGLRGGKLGGRLVLLAFFGDCLLVQPLPACP